MLSAITVNAVMPSVAVSTALMYNKLRFPSGVSMKTHQGLTTINYGEVVTVEGHNVDRQFVICH